MKPRVVLTRVHKVNEPDQRQADCYINEFSHQQVGKTPQEALDKVCKSIDYMLNKDWYDAHSWDGYLDYRRELMIEEHNRRQRRGELKNQPKPEKPWKWWMWFYNPQG